MLGIEHLPLFIISGLLLNITPGQDTFYIIGQTLAHGRRAGVFAVLGIMTGCLIHTTMAALGLSALLAASASAYRIVKTIGAAYLVYLGLKMLVARRPTLSSPVTAELGTRTIRSIFRGGLFSNVLNPKTALFFLAFLPQFVSPASEHRTLAFLALGTLFIVDGTPWCLFLVWTASAMRRRLTSSRRVMLNLERGIGALFVGLGLRLGFTR